MSHQQTKPNFETVEEFGEFSVLRRVEGRHVNYEVFERSERIPVPSMESKGKSSEGREASLERVSLLSLGFCTSRLPKALDEAEALEVERLNTNAFGRRCVSE
jgi:hypothetical protein